MKLGEFTINGVSSASFNAYIQERPSIPSARRKMELKQIPGVSGDYIFDEGAFDNVSLSLSLYTTGKTQAEVNNHRQGIVSLFNSGTYQDMEFYHDPGYVYEVILTDSIDFNPNGQTPLLLPFTLTLSIKPFKRVKDIKEVSGSSLTITNPTAYASKPEITVYGNKDFILKVNGVDYPFKSIDDHVVVDSEVQHAYKRDGNKVMNRNHRMFTHQFPQLHPGQNALSLSGGATRMVVKPRWVVKLWRLLHYIKPTKPPLTTMVWEFCMN